MNKTIHFITGASGVGKTTLLESLKVKYPKSISVNFDSIGVPSEEDMIKEYGSGSAWQEAMTNIWIDRLINEYDEEIIFFEGQVNFNFIKSGFKSHKFDNYTITLLDCNTDEMTSRLIDRGQPELANENMFNWLKYLRNQALEFGCNIIENSKNTKEETLEQFLSNINKITNK